jgi:hypothetical protein
MPVDDRHRQTQKVRAVQPPADKLGRRKVLVFADPDRVKEIATRLRPASHYEIVPGSNPIGATMLSIRSGAHAVIIDVSVAGLPGGKLLQILRKHPRLSNIGMVLLCHGADLRDVRNSYASSQRDDVLSTTMLDGLQAAIERAIAAPTHEISAPLEAVPSAKRPAP